MGCEGLCLQRSLPLSVQTLGMQIKPIQSFVSREAMEGFIKLLANHGLKFKKLIQEQGFSPRSPTAYIKLSTRRNFSGLRCRDVDYSGGGNKTEIVVSTS